jgi:hypothetical protein
MANSPSLFTAFTFASFSNKYLEIGKKLFWNLLGISGFFGEFVPAHKSKPIASCSQAALKLLASCCKMLTSHSQAARKLLASCSQAARKLFSSRYQFAHKPLASRSQAAHKLLTSCS